MRRVATAVCTGAALVTLVTACSSTPDTPPPKKPTAADRYLTSMRAILLSRPGANAVSFTQFTDTELLRYGRAVCHAPTSGTSHGTEVNALIRTHTMTTAQALVVRRFAQRDLC